ncbi:CHAT domain protein [Rhizoctonia solani]|uniref:CHAT domain protein n=1 Tax=Rhizoctonia solani TaxID=456999 RepID=A0A8H8T1W9_9AGAM|nr:CHAT domain protein [Rhizoctonia solani]QRW25779.1 CHAT domain protein [Rhizoctonia solani]
MSKTVVYADQLRVGDVDSERDGTEVTSASAMSQEEKPESAASGQNHSESVQVKSLGPEELYKLGKSHLNEYDRFGRIDDIDKAIKYHVCAVDLTTHGDPELAERLTELGICYDRRYRRLGKVEDMEGSLECDDRAVELTAEGDPELARRLANLGISYSERYRRLGEATDLDRSLEHRSRALALTPDGHPDLPDRHASLGVSYSDRYRRLGEAADLDRSLEHLSRALALTPDGHPDLPGRHASLGVSYSDRYRRLGEAADLDRSLEHDSRALALTPDGHPDLPGRHASLGVSYTDRYRRLGEAADLDRSLEHLSRALALTPDGHPDLPRRHASLGASYTDRYRRLGEAADLDRSLEHDSRALALTPDGHPDLPGRHASLGVSYSDRYRRLGEATDLDRSLEHRSRALALTPDGHPDLPRRHASLGVSYSDRYRRLGEAADLDRSLEHFSRALALTPDGHPDLPRRHASLGASYTDRYRRLGEAADLDRSLEHRSRALALTPDGHPDLPRRHASLGVSYSDRYRRLGEAADLDRSLEHLSRALALTPDGHPDLPDRHASLGVSYSDRYRRLGEAADLDRSLEHLSRALALTPDGHPDLPDRHASLGVSYSDRYRRLGEAADLDRSLEHFSRALALTPDGHPDLPDRHASLGVSYSDRYRRLGEAADLDRSLEHLSRALALTPLGHPGSPLRHFSYAVSCHDQYLHTADSYFLQVSLDSFRKSSSLLAGPPRDAFDMAMRWANLAAKHSSLQPIQAFHAVVDLLPHYISLGSTTTQRYHDLLSAQNIAVRAAFIAIQSSDHTLALEWLEHTRCVVWNQSLMLRSPLQDLASAHPDLASQLRSVSHQLHHATSSSLLLDANLSTTDTSEHRYRLARQYTDLIAQARSLAGFESPLGPMDAAGLVRAARHGPIVVINCYEHCCDALIVTPGSSHIAHLALPNFSQEAARHALSNMQAALRRKNIRDRGVKRIGEHPPNEDIGRVLAALWNNVVKPVLDYMGYTVSRICAVWMRYSNCVAAFKNAVPVGGMPHITWCPTGALSFLPLHAAGDYDLTQSKVFDYAVSSYTPTLTALLGSGSSLTNCRPRILGVGQAATPGLTPLPGTTTELGYLQAHSKQRTDYWQLTDERATRKAVLDAMDEYDWVHLACHASQDLRDSTKSRFYLHDGTLDLSAINQRTFRSKGLAYLSACQTATGDEKLPDEAIHLASGMLMAGYRSVIASLWSVMDEDAPFVADKVYGRLLEDGKVGNGEAGRALHDAVAGLREKVGEKEFGRWVPYIHIGS